MIISVTDVIARPEFSNYSAEDIEEKLLAIEQLIRSYTNNNFQNRFIRFEADSVGTTLHGVSPFLKVGDTVQITNSRVNDGLYTITEIGADFTAVDKPLFMIPYNLVTKVEYKADIVKGALDLLKWEFENRKKVGLKSEALSRYSVTYYDQDANNTVMGYPVSQLGFLRPYMVPRF